VYVLPCDCMQGHQGPVNTLAALRLGSGSIVLASTAADENVLIWECPADSGSRAHQEEGPCSTSEIRPESQDGDWTGRWKHWNLVQTIPWGVQLQHCVALSQLPGKPNWCEATLPISTSAPECIWRCWLLGNALAEVHIYVPLHWDIPSVPMESSAISGYDPYSLHWLYTHLLYAVLMLW